MTLRIQGSVCLCLVELILKVTTKDTRQRGERASLKTRSGVPKGKVFLFLPVGMHIPSDVCKYAPNGGSMKHLF